MPVPVHTDESVLSGVGANGPEVRSRMTMSCNPMTSHVFWPAVITLVADTPRCLQRSDSFAALSGACS